MLIPGRQSLEVRILLGKLRCLSGNKRIEIEFEPLKAFIVWSDLESPFASTSFVAQLGWDFVAGLSF
jgi:hypothetical protein